jgi:hypothetical protein
MCGFSEVFDLLGAVFSRIPVSFSGACRSWVDLRLRVALPATNLGAFGALKKGQGEQ